VTKIKYAVPIAIFISEPLMKRVILNEGYNGRDLILTLEKRRRLDILIAEKVKRAVLRSARKNPGNIVLDLQSVGFIDSAAIAMLMEVNEKLSETGRNFRITGVSKEAMELIRLVPVLESLISPPVFNPEPVPAFPAQGNKKINYSLKN
jgi:anti-anti-sigma factor